jgi:hypothetical protein
LTATTGTFTNGLNINTGRIGVPYMAVGNGKSSIGPNDDSGSGLFFSPYYTYLIKNGTSCWQFADGYGFIYSNDLTISSTRVECSAYSITPGSGTGLTVNSTGNLNRQVYKVTVDYTGFSAAATHAHHVIATLPAKTRIVGIIADTTAAYSGGAVSACTLEVGKTTDTGIEYILLHDVKTTAVVKGLVDGDLGESLIHDHAVQGGDLPSWTTTTDITATIRTTDANTSALGAGSTTFYITTERF